MPSTKPKRKRKVYISLEKGTIWVKYCGRNKYQRYAAAQFDARYSTMEEVKHWIHERSHLELSAGPNP